MRLSTLAIALFACYTTTHAADVKQSLDNLHANLSAVSSQITSLSATLTELVGKIQSPASPKKFHKGTQPSPPPYQKPNAGTDNGFIPLPSHHKFIMMQKSGVPEQAIYNQMQGKFTDAQIRDVLGDEFVNSQAPQAPKTAVIKPSLHHAGGGGKIGGLLSDIQNGAKLKKPEQQSPPPKEKQSSQPINLFEQARIQQEIMRARREAKKAGKEPNSAAVDESKTETPDSATEDQKIALEEEIHSLNAEFEQLLQLCTPNGRTVQPLGDINQAQITGFSMPPSSGYGAKDQEQLLYNESPESPEIISAYIRANNLQQVVEYSQEDALRFQYLRSENGRAYFTWADVERLYQDTTIFGQEPVYQLNNNSNWLAIADIIKHIRWVIDANAEHTKTRPNALERSTLKQLIFQRVIANFHLPYDMQALNIALMQTGYTEASFIRLVASSCLWYPDHTAYHGNYHFKILTKVCLWHLLKIIRSSALWDQESGGPTSPSIKQAISTECDEHESAASTNVMGSTTKQTNLGFVVQGASKLTNLGQQATYGAHGEVVRAILRHALLLRSQLDEKQAELAALQSNPEKIKNQELNIQRRLLEEIALLEYTDPVQASQKRQDLLNLALTTSMLRLAADTKWTLAYIKKSFVKWAGETVQLPTDDIKFIIALYVALKTPELIDNKTTDPATESTARTLAQNSLDAIANKILSNSGTMTTLLSSGTDKANKARTLLLYVLINIAAQHNLTCTKITGKPWPYLNDCIAVVQNQILEETIPECTYKPLEKIREFLSEKISFDEFKQFLPEELTPRDYSAELEDTSL